VILTVSINYFFSIALIHNQVNYYLARVKALIMYLSSPHKAQDKSTLDFYITSTDSASHP